ncbi:hypothetical protein [Vreelandella jeotgali]|uniref:hypothetical protein n=1 Tax=Vreelandella jeotgali TaxID=553386 RepID=UPI00034A79E1|nr:hypothetical protein [Halomonas jeotgali]
MKLRFALWCLGVLLKRALRRKPRFAEQLEKRRMDFGIATEDLSIARYYRLSTDGIQTQAGLPTDLDLELRFADADAALAVLKKPTSRAFFDGMRQNKVRLVGDSAEMTRLQKLLKNL